MKESNLNLENIFCRGWISVLLKRIISIDSKTPPASFRSYLTKILKYSCYIPLRLNKLVLSNNNKSKGLPHLYPNM